MEHVRRSTAGSNGSACEINRQRWRYNLRNRFGFSDDVDAELRPAVVVRRHLAWSAIDPARLTDSVRSGPDAKRTDRGRESRTDFASGRIAVIPDGVSGRTAGRFQPMPATLPPGGQWSSRL